MTPIHLAFEMGEVVNFYKQKCTYIFCRVIVGISQRFWPGSLGKYIEVLTFRFPCLYGLCVVAPSSRKSKDDRHYKPFGYTAACWTLFRTKYCVFRWNGALDPGSLRMEKRRGWGSTVGYSGRFDSAPILPWHCSYRKLPLSPRKAVAQSLQFLVVVKVELPSIVDPRAPDWGAQGFCSTMSANRLQA